MHQITKIFQNSLPPYWQLSTVQEIRPYSFLSQKSWSGSQYGFGRYFQPNWPQFSTVKHKRIRHFKLKPKHVLRDGRIFKESIFCSTYQNCSCTNYKVVQIWPGQTVTCLHANHPGHIWNTLYMYTYLSKAPTRLGLYIRPSSVSISCY